MKDDPAPVFHVLDHDAGLLLAASRRADGDDLYWRVTQFLVPNHSLAPGSGAGRHHFGQTLGADRRPQLLGLRLQLEPRAAADRPRRTASSRASRASTPRSTSTGCPSATAATTTSSTARPRSTRSFTGIEGISEQDAAIQDSQGFIADRTREHLGPTDLGIVRFRRLILDAARTLAAGEEPPAAAAPHAYRVRSGGTVAPDGTPVEEVLRARFGSDIGKVPQTQS